MYIIEALTFEIFQFLLTDDYVVIPNISSYFNIVLSKLL